MTARVCIIGAGFVGLTTATVFAERGFDVSVIELSLDRVTALQRGEVPFHEPGLSEAWSDVIKTGRVIVCASTSAFALEHMAEADVTFICTPTPTVDGAHDTSAVTGAAEAWARAQLASKNARWGFLVIRSTVLPGVPAAVDRAVRLASGRAAGNWFKSVYQPEFLAEGSALRDTREPVRVVLGWVHPDEVGDAERQQLGQVVGDPDSVLHTTSETASMIKYASNTMLAARLSMMQEIGVICGRVGADIVTVSRALAQDPRIGSQFLAAGAGWGGSCFPKDVRALAELAEHVEVPGVMARATVHANDTIAHAWVVDVLRRLRRAPRAIAWLGTAFKPGTSDTRDSASLAALGSVLGAWPTTDVRVHDPHAVIDIDGVHVVSSPLDAARGADVIVLGVAWPEYTDLLSALLTVASKEDVVVIDTRNLWSPSPVNLPCGALYVPFGRPPVCG